MRKYLLPPSTYFLYFFMFSSLLFATISQHRKCSNVPTKTSKNMSTDFALSMTCNAFYLSFSFEGILQGRLVVFLFELSFDIPHMADLALKPMSTSRRRRIFCNKYNQSKHTDFIATHIQSINQIQSIKTHRIYNHSMKFKVEGGVNP